MAELVAIDLPGGPAFVDAVRRCWDRGDAVLPLDRRLPPAARAATLQALRPTQVLDEHGLTAVDGEPAEPGDGLVIATSGSSGEPKGVVLTMAALQAAAGSSTTALGIGQDDTWLCCLPLAHIGGFGVLSRALLSGNGLIVHDGFQAERVTSAAERGATAVSLVSTVLDRIDPAMFRVILLGGSRPPAVRPGNCIATYGLTESCGGVVYDGRPLPGVEIRIDHDGEILLRTPTALRAYRGSTTAEHPVHDGWLHTGDLGALTDDGRLVVDGRRGDLIVTGAEKVWPEPVEQRLREHPAIVYAGVAGVDDPKWGQRVTAWVVPVAGDDAPTLADVRAFVRESLPAYMAPRELIVVEAIPRTSLGKVARARLVRTGAN